MYSLRIRERSLNLRTSHPNDVVWNRVYTYQKYARKDELTMVGETVWNNSLKANIPRFAPPPVTHPFCTLRSSPLGKGLHICPREQHTSGKMFFSFLQIFPLTDRGKLDKRHHIDRGCIWRHEPELGILTSTWVT